MAGKTCVRDVCTFHMRREGLPKREHVYPLSHDPCMQSARVAIGIENDSAQLRLHVQVLFGRGFPLLTIWRESCGASCPGCTVLKNS